MVFKINKKTGLRKAYRNEGDNSAVAIYGKVYDLKAIGVLDYAAEGTDEKVLVLIAPNYYMYECNTIAEAKDYINDLFKGE